jgi:hypothetical protein
MDVAEAYLAIATLLTPAGTLHYANPRLTHESECETRAYAEVVEMALAVKGAVVAWSCLPSARPSRLMAFRPKWRLADGRALTSTMILPPPPEEE